MPSLTPTHTDREDSGSGVADCSHSLRVKGYTHRGSHSRMDCAQPLRAVCEKCGWQTYWRCNCSSAEKCADCAERRRKLVARLVDVGTSTRLGTGHTYFLTLNGPGEQEHKRWRQGRGGNDRPACDCHRVWVEMRKGDWNKQESACWNRLRTALSRLCGELTYIGSVETQSRGVLHRHVVLNSARVLLPEEVGALALAAGYGCVHDLQPVRSAAKAAWYISKYVTKSSGERSGVPWRAEVLDKATGEVRVMETTPTFRTWSAARNWGYTLKGLREIAKAQARAREQALHALGAVLPAPAAAAGLALTADRDHSPP